MFKKTFVIIILFFAVNLDLLSQKTSDLGIFLGNSFYLGELNPKRQIGGGVSSFSYGAIYRYNLNQRYSLKASLIKGKLKAEDQVTNNFEFNEFRNAKFESKLTEFSSQIEFNFLPFKTGDKRFFFTPYLLVGGSFYRYDPIVEIDGVPYENEEAEPSTKFAIPFGVGLKLSIGKRTNLVYEWAYRKTSNDYIDGIPNRIELLSENGKNYNNDWYIIRGFSLTINITKEGPCPVYRF